MTVRRSWLIASAVAAVALYALLWAGYALGWRWQDGMDAAVLDPLYRYGAARPGWVRGWDVYCTVLGPAAFRILGAALVVVALVRRNLRTALFLVVTVELSGIVTETAKFAADRPRPDTAFVSAMSTSFPSGHALGVLISVAALLTVARPLLPPPLRIPAVAAGAVVVVTIGVGRLVLNVHHTSDVLAGWALGYAWFALCVLVVPPAGRITEADERPAAPGTAP